MSQIGDFAESFRPSTHLQLHIHISQCSQWVAQSFEHDKDTGTNHEHRLLSKAMKPNSKEADQCPLVRNTTSVARLSFASLAGLLNWLPYINGSLLFFNLIFWKFNKSAKQSEAIQQHCRWPAGGCIQVQLAASTAATRTTFTWLLHHHKVQDHSRHDVHPLNNKRPRKM